MTARRWVSLAAAAALVATLAACDSELASVLPDGPTLLVTAKNIAFDPLEPTTPVGRAFGIDLVQQDPRDISHDIQIRASNDNVVFDGDSVDGGRMVTYRIGPLPAGRYVFICSIHPIPSMTGTLVVR